jgi:hypothetical protein
MPDVQGFVVADHASRTPMQGASDVHTTRSSDDRRDHR